MRTKNACRSKLPIVFFFLFFCIRVIAPMLFVLLLVIVVLLLFLFMFMLLLFVVIEVDIFPIARFNKIRTSNFIARME